MHAGTIRNRKHWFRLIKIKLLLIAFSIQVQKQEFSEEGFMSIIGMAAGDNEEKVNIGKEIAKACKDIKDPDRCEMAIKIGKCMEKEAKERNLSME